MKNGGMFKLIATLACAALVLFSAGSVFAGVGGSCVNCHTMHNSTGGSTMQYDTSNLNPSPTLLRAGTCVGCHMDPLAGLAGAPQVDEAAGSYTAGGSFLFVTTIGDNNGHNVVGINATDLAHDDVPPGFNNVDYNANTAINAAAPWVAGTQLTCAGTVGCHGTHAGETNQFAAIKGAHHSDDTTITGATVGTSYRFLNGIVGIEDTDYELTTGADDHNFYKGATSDSVSDTISYLCAECHGNFHTRTAAGTGLGSPWLRHPTDIDMIAVGGEYAAYTYSAEAPAALTNPTALSVDADYTASAIVTCVSCHRPHGSENADLLRWDYSTMVAGGGDTGGCFNCHTTKD